MNNIDLELISAKFHTNGFALIENVFPLELIDELKNEVDTLLDQFDPNEVSQIFSPGLPEQSDNMEYFLSSSDKIHYFLEKEAYDPIQKCLRVLKKDSLNKIGHGLHCLNPIFKSFTFDSRNKLIGRSIGLIDPLVVQSMILFKNPRVGSEVPPHQDATYLYSNPDPSVVGFWIPLEDATESNGCLQFIPGSHRTASLMTRWVRKRNPDGVIKMVYVDMDGQEIEDFNNHQKYEIDQFKSVPAPKGSCVLIHGLVVHRSDPNHSKLPRPAYAFHVFDQGYQETNIKEQEHRPKRQWDPLNWLQPTDQYSFPSLYNTTTTS